VHPELPVLLMSGYADDALVNRGIDSSQVDILGKPFSAAELRRRVHALIKAR
jgi:DNA-binding response OmpR family regulator